MELKALERELGKLVTEYFYDMGYGRCVPAVSYSQYDIKKYTFRMVCQTLNAQADWVCNDRMDLDSFRREVRLLLKQCGFTKCKFDTKKITVKGGAFGEYTVTRLTAIYFDR